MMIRHLLIASLFCGFTFSLMARESGVPSKRASPEELERALENNFRALKESQDRVILERPTADYGNFAYVLMDSVDGGVQDAFEMRKAVAENLPPRVKLVLLVEDNPSRIRQVKQQFSNWVSEDRIILAVDDTGGGGFWARDAFPVPVFRDTLGNVDLVAHRYFRHFEAHDVVAGSVAAQNLHKKNFTFVGGNLLADETGTCFVVNSSRRFGLSADQIKEAYACKDVHFLPFVRGIGDVDEVIKPLPGGRMLTNIPDYVPTLKQLGYEVILLPSLPQYYRTYANSLLLNGTVFMPTYDVPEDDEARSVYEGLGYKVVGVPSAELSDTYNGSIHCQTMAYPNMDLQKLLKGLLWRQVQ